MAMWNPWRGCHRCSEGCKFCYIHKGDGKRGVNTDEIVKTDNFYAPVARKKNGEYKMKPGLVYLGFSTDFLLPEADEWRKECWDMIRERNDCTFLFLTKRIERFMDCVPEDWGEGWDNVVVGCTVENQRRAEERLEIFSKLPVRHKNIICQPMISAINLEAYLDGVELVMAGGRVRPLCQTYGLRLGTVPAGAVHPQGRGVRISAVWHPLYKGRQGIYSAKEGFVFPGPESKH